MAANINLAWQANFNRPSSSRPASYAGPPPHRSCNDTAYNGSQGFIDDLTHASPSSPYTAATPTVTTTSSAASSPRPTGTGARQSLSARLQSAVSNAQSAAALTRQNSVLHTRAKSLAAFVPKLAPAPSFPGPEKRESSGLNRSITDLFYGESAPIRLTPPISPVKEKEEMEFIMEYRPQFTERPRDRPQRRSTAELTKSTSAILSASASRASNWFTRRSTLPTPAPAITEQQPDEFAHVNISSALFPNGSTDPLDPASFNDLLLNATSLLERMQAAYREKVAYIATVRPEMEAQKEEREEAETRTRHLKMQLEDLNRQAQEHDDVVQDLVTQLAEEKLKVRALQDDAIAAATARNSSHPRLERRQTTDDENPSDSPFRRKRSSAGSASDSGFESDVDAASVFSAGTSVSATTSGARSPNGTLTTLAPHHMAVADWTLAPPKARDAVAPTKFARGGKPIPLRLGSGSANASNATSASTAGKRIGSEGAAWATVELLKAENGHLKRELETLHSDLQECIDFVGGVAPV